MSKALPEKAARSLSNCPWPLEKKHGGYDKELS
jgi:hypothetical protein